MENIKIIFLHFKCIVRKILKRKDISFHVAGIKREINRIINKNKIMSFKTKLENTWLDLNEINKRKLDSNIAYGVLTEDLIYQNDNKYTITIPKGFITDFASIPHIFFSLFEPNDPHWIRAAVLHDYGYTTNGEMGIKLKLTRKEVDYLLDKAMIEEGSPKWKANLFYYAVRTFGGAVWKRKHINAQNYY